jgi:hypothetical protein
MLSIINLSIAAVILAFAFLIKHVFSESLEEDNAFVWLVASFMLAYLVAALAMSFINPLDRIAPIMAAQQTQESEEPVVRL